MAHPAREVVRKVRLVHARREVARERAAARVRLALVVGEAVKLLVEALRRARVDLCARARGREHMGRHGERERESVVRW